MNRTAHLKEPIACTERERREFELLVRQGFQGSEQRNGIWSTRKGYYYQILITQHGMAVHGLQNS